MPRERKIGHIEIVQDVSASAKGKAYTDVWVGQVRKNLRRLAEGNLDVDLAVQDADAYTKELHSTYFSINKDMSLVAESIMALAQDAAMLSQAAVEGRLATRADGGKHKGVYGEIVTGVNDCLDAVIGPLNSPPICR